MSSLIPVSVPARRVISMAVGDYDRTRPLINGTVAVDGFGTSVVTGDLEEIFAQAFTSAALDITELSFSNYLIATSRGECPYVALPVFPSRSFRHSAIYVRTDRGILSPVDLRGKRIGSREYSNTASLVVRGVLADEYGFVPEDSQWVIGDVDRVERTSIDSRHWPRDRLKIEGVVGKTLAMMLEQGEIDALIAYRPPPGFGSSPNIDRLFPDWRSAEKDYFRRTRRFPIMHVMAIRKDVLAEHPELPAALVKAFGEAKDIAQARLAVHQAPAVMLPWLTAECEETQAVMGADFWSYGLNENRDILQTQVRWSHEQGLIPQRLDLHQLFAMPPSLSSLALTHS